MSPKDIDELSLQELDGFLFIIDAMNKREKLQVMSR